jgi:hypothetical protein
MSSVPITITATEARELLKRAVEEKGENYVYRKPLFADHCVYFSAGAPSCLIGHVLSYKGMESIDDSMNGCGVEDLFENGYLAADDATRDALDMAQTEQDHGGTWGTAVAVALLRLDKAKR